MCVIGEKWNAGCLYHRKGTVVDGRLQPLERKKKHILSSYNLFWKLKENILSRSEHTELTFFIVAVLTPKL